MKKVLVGIPGKDNLSEEDILSHHAVFLGKGNLSFMKENSELTKNTKSFHRLVKHPFYILGRCTVTI